MKKKPINPETLPDRERCKLCKPVCTGCPVYVRKLERKRKGGGRGKRETSVHG